MKNKIKAIFFDIDDTLYDSSRQASLARKNAVKAMIEAGLDVSEEESIYALKEIVEKFGSNHPHHFDELLKEFSYNPNPRIIAAGVVAYHTTKIAYLVPFPDTIPTLLSLRDSEYKLGIITDGISVKQWEKVIRLGLQHFFHSVTISSDVGRGKPDPEIFKIAVEKTGYIPGETLMVGDRIDRDISGANKAGMVTAQIMKGRYKRSKPRDESEEPDYIISKLSDILSILETD
jgi:putative hydrolase of the HAD superfamily